MRIMLLVPGILASRADFAPGQGIHKLVPYIVSVGYLAWPIYPGRFNFRHVRFAGALVAHTIASFVRELSYAGHEVSGVAHSHGARLLAEASTYDAPFHTLAFINGAIDKDVKIGAGVGRVLNYYVRSDKVLGFANLLLLNPMGNAGKLGINLAKTPRVVNGNLTEICGAVGHSDYEDDDKLPKFARAWLADLAWITADGAVERGESIIF